jgi:hypothetical protein
MEGTQAISCFQKFLFITAVVAGATTDRGAWTDLYMFIHVNCKLYVLTTDLLLLTVTLANNTSSRQRERPRSTKKQLSNSNKDLALRPRWVLYSKIDWPTDRRS